MKLLKDNLSWKLLLDPELEFPEAYMRNEIEIENASMKDFLMDLVKNLGRGEISTTSLIAKKMFQVWRTVTNFNLPGKSRKNVEHHYDIGGARGEKLYDIFLDKNHRLYSCAYWKNDTKNLEEAQQNKIDNLLNYLAGRGIGPDWYDFMYSTDQYFNFDQRLIIPFYWRGDIVGYTGRLFEQSEKVKYVTEVQPGYVFNMDAQDWSRKFVIVTEGPFDAITTSGVSILGSEINDIQRELIEGLNRKIIVVPDRDRPGEKLINQAIEFGWSVAFPEWHDSVEDLSLIHI